MTGPTNRATTAPRAENMVTPSLRSLLAQIIDYAGLFPPAKLQMEPTVRNYASYVRCNDAWMLGRVIVPVGRLEEFEAHAAEVLPSGEEAEPWRVSAITSPAGDDQLAGHLQQIAAFNEKHTAPAAGRAVIDVLELRGRSTAAIEQALDLIPDELFPFFEIPIAEDPRGLIATIVGSDAGAKVRTGGVTADLYPAPAHLARFISACAASEVPFKATAGLHHPLRHLSPAVGCQEFGFLNVFIGACLARAGAIEEEELCDLLESESVSEFTIESDGIAWRGHDLSIEDILAARERFAVSFGSCSFDEPREDLRTLGLL